MLKAFYKKGTRGFTLIELLVVIAIIGVLASIVLASLNTARKKSRDARRLADIKQLQLALELYFDANSSSYPAGTSLSAVQTQGFIPVVPADPSLSTLNYNYQALSGSPLATCATAPCSSYHLGGVLAETTNPALLNDADNTLGFDGTSHGTEGTAPGCTGTGSSAQPAGGSTGENCYDVKP